MFKRLFKDSNLPGLLVALHRETDFLSRAKAQRSRLPSKYDPYHIKYISPLMLRDYLLEILRSQNGFETKGHQVDWENLRKDPGYQVLLDQILS